MTHRGRPGVPADRVTLADIILGKIKEKHDEMASGGAAGAGSGGGGAFQVPDEVNDACSFPFLLLLLLLFFFLLLLLVLGRDEIEPTVPLRRYRFASSSPAPRNARRRCKTCRSTVSPTRPTQSNTQHPTPNTQHPTPNTQHPPKKRGGKGNRDFWRHR